MVKATDKRFYSAQRLCVGIDPFAGAGDLVRAGEELGLKRVMGYDVDPEINKKYGWWWNNSLEEIPLAALGTILITNPPYLGGMNDSVCGGLSSLGDTTDPITPWMANPTDQNTYTWTFVLHIAGLTPATAGASVYEAKLSAQTYGTTSSGRVRYNTGLITLTTGAAPVIVSQPEPAAVPEPASLLLLGAAFLGLGLAERARRDR